MREGTMSHPRMISTLLVDDDPGDVSLLRSALTSERDPCFSIRRAQDLRSAVAALDAEPVDVVLLDLGLPDSVGLSTYEAFRAVAPDVPVVVLTHLADDDIALEAVRLGAQDYVVKGTVDELQLARTVRHATERGRLMADVARLAGHQRVLADLGRRSAEGTPLAEQLAHAAEQVGTCLQARLALLIQRRADGRYVVQASVGDDALEGELLPPLLASQLPHAHTPEPLLLEDVAALDLPSRRDIPVALRDASNLLVLPLRGVAWSGALALVDTPAVHHDASSRVFVRAVGTLLEEAMRRFQAESDLEERAKELAALAAVGRVLQEDAAPPVLLAAVCHEVVKGMQFPHRAVVRIEVDEVSVVSDGEQRGLAEELTAPIVVHGERRGQVVAGHRAIHGFLPHYEQQLLDAVAENLSLWLERNDTLGQVRASEAELRSVLEQIPGVVWTAGPDMRIRWHAGRAHDRISLEPNERRGQHVAEALGEDHPIVEAVHEALAGRSAMYESTSDGRCFESRVEPLRADDGEIIGAIGMGVDVTDVVEARRELTESRRRLEGLFNHAHDAFLLADDEGCYVDANPAAARLTGYSVEQLRGMAVADLSVAEDEDTVAAGVARLRSGGRLEGAWRLRRADGQVLDTRLNAVADIVPGVHLSVVTDVTERARAEAALRVSEERFRRLAENARDVIYRFGVTETPSFEYVSPAVEELLGCTPEQLYADPGLALGMLDDEDRDRLFSCVIDPRTHPAPFVGRMQRSDGRHIWVEERHAYVFDDEGQHVATEGVVRDITARKQLEDELREGLLQEQAAAADLRTLNEMKDVFLTAVSHELRTPLTSLKGMSHTLLAHHDKISADQKRLLLERLVANADRLQHVLDDLLDIDRLTRGAALLKVREVDVAAVVGRTLERLPTGGHPITSRLDPVRAHVDEAKLERIVENLVVNAMRHTADGVPVWVHVEDAGDEVLVCVQDAGDGIPLHLRERIFEPFEVGDGPAARVGGLGVGLSLVSRFVELHGGTVSVGDRDGGGASFCIALPKRPVTEVDGAEHVASVTSGDELALSAGRG